MQRDGPTQIPAAFTVPEDVDEALVDFPFAGAGPITAQVVFRVQPESRAFGDSLAALPSHTGMRPR
ncbi:hypothetical protein HD597_005332 [Nonomuraea thailandensis]|uniref:Uncharacterized protein n=1 Tax=Nonomuraea thailandensis TaxID=1188745 RepID=A0A9X2K2F0_9ACTN|nr:hypothetical protein [Nonomuraea thailandensis]MCP2358312.1 hypothetical protein [Nonomuraea thailandensis]